VIGNGAGLVMATLDTLKYSNFKAANFCDAPGGTSKKAMMESLKIVTRKKGIIALFINIFGGMTKTDDVAKAIVAFKRKCTPTMPIIIRIYGTNYEEAHEILKKNNMKAFKTIASAMNELKKQCQL